MLGELIISSYWFIQINEQKAFISVALADKDVEFKKTFVLTQRHRLIHLSDATRMFLGSSAPPIIQYTHKGIQLL